MCFSDVLKGEMATSHIQLPRKYASGMLPMLPFKEADDRKPHLPEDIHMKDCTSADGARQLPLEDFGGTGGMTSDDVLRAHMPINQTMSVCQ